jgi:hypothetical protein
LFEPWDKRTVLAEDHMGTNVERGKKPSERELTAGQSSAVIEVDDEPT